MRVTNLNDTGTGSLRACIQASGPRVCVFEVAGTITLASQLTLSNPFITIAGQTAPSQGITVRGKEFRINAHDVLIQHIRVRPGDLNSPGDADAIGITDGAFNIVIDHVTATWSIDEAASAFGANTHDVTFSNMIIAEALYCSVHSGSVCHSMGGVAKYSTRVSLIRNLIAHNNARNYNFGNSDQQPAQFSFVNNVVYNWGNVGTHVDPDSDSGLGYKHVNIIGNVYKSGTNSTLADAILVEGRTNQKVYVSDNIRNGVNPVDPWTIVHETGPSTRSATPLFSIGFTPLAASLVQTSVLANVGARPTDRDSVDTQIVADVTAGTGQIIDSQDQIGGFPTLTSATPATDTDHDGMPDDWETSRCLNPNSAADANMDRNGDGYTNLEEYLNSLFP